MQSLILLIHILACMTLVILVLMQQGKGADLGAMGSGASQTVFGSRGAASFIVRLTVWVAIIFFVTSLALGYLTAHQPRLADRFEHIENLAKQNKSATPPASH
jgi:preprotein translocase subunit SecG